MGVGACQRPLNRVGTSSRWWVAGKACGRCCVLSTRGRLKRQPRSGSDRHGQLVERHRQPPGQRLFHRQLVMPSPNVLHEPMPSDDHPGAAVLLEPPHWPQPRLQPAVVGLDVVVGIPLGAMLGRRQQRLENHRGGLLRRPNRRQAEVPASPEIRSPQRARRTPRPTAGSPVPRSPARSGLGVGSGRRHAWR
jgi:hypothetical protein